MRLLTYHLFRNEFSDLESISALDHPWGKERMSKQFKMAQEVLCDFNLKFNSFFIFLYGWSYPKDIPIIILKTEFSSAKEMKFFYI